MRSAVRDVLAERQRQIDVEGWTPEHDDKHDDGELAVAGACYALAFAPNAPLTDDLWPWDVDHWKPKDRRRNLVRAAALIIADIERLDREAQPGRRPCPPHYAQGGYELADVIDAFGLGRWETPAVQYVFRAALKFDGAHRLDDIRKAIELLVRVADEIRGEPTATPVTPAVAAPAPSRIGAIPDDVTPAEALDRTSFIFSLEARGLLGRMLDGASTMSMTLRWAVEYLTAKGFQKDAQELVDAAWRVMASRDASPAKGA